MKFEWDENKSNINFEKHGIDFKKATQLWEGLTLTIKANIVSDETRYLTIGKIKLDLYTAIWTKRGDKIRLISVRKSHKTEREIYEKKELEGKRV